MSSYHGLGMGVFLSLSPECLVEQWAWLSAPLASWQALDVIEDCVVEDMTGLGWAAGFENIEGGDELMHHIMSRTPQCRTQLSISHPCTKLRTQQSQPSVLLKPGLAEMKPHACAVCRVLCATCRQAKEDSLVALPLCLRSWGPAAVKPHLQAVSTNSLSLRLSTTLSLRRG